MKFTIVKEPIPFLIIDNTYDKDEQILIYREIDFFTGKLLGPEDTGSAKTDQGELKSNSGVFLDNVYANRSFSDILTINRKMFSQEVAYNLSQCHYAYNIINNVNSDATLLSYYDNGDSYFSHKDKVAITAVTWFFKEPKNFTGGDFIFPDFDVKVEVKNNRSVIFFSSYLHAVTPVRLIYKDIPFSGRFTLSQFYGII